MGDQSVASPIFCEVPCNASRAQSEGRAEEARRSSSAAFVVKGAETRRGGGSARPQRHSTWRTRSEHLLSPHTARCLAERIASLDSMVVGRDTPKDNPARLHI